MNNRRWVFLCTLAMLWGCSFMFMAICLETIPVFSTAFSRLALAGFLLLVVALVLREEIILDLQFLKEILILGLIRAALPITLILWAQVRIDSGLAGILNSTSALFTLLVAHFLTDNEKITPNKLTAVIFGMVGVALIIGIDALRGFGDQVTGQLAMLAATLSYGFANVYGRRFQSRSATVSAAGMLLAGALWVLPFTLYVDWPIHTLPSVRSSLALVLLAALSTAGAFVVWFKLITLAGANNTVLVTFLISPVALIMGILVLNESPDASDYAGLALIATGQWFSQKNGRKHSD